MEKILIIWGIFLTVTNLETSATVNECPVTANCDCSHFVDCHMRNLTELPPMVKTEQKFGYVSFKSNFITRIHDGYFVNLALISNSLIIDLSYNKINYISPQAFQGLENVALDLRMEHNNIVALPTALLLLNNLQHLRISGIHTYGLDIVGHIGTTLTMLYVGDLTEWPEGLKLFKDIQSLYLFQLRMSKISAGDVTSLASSLDSIVIQDSSFEEPLDGLCSLNNIWKLQLINLTSPEGVELIPQCQPPATSVKSLLVHDTYLTNLSKIQKSMPGLTSIDLTLPTVRRLTLPANNKIQSVYLSSTSLEKLPTSTGTSEHLLFLSILNSKISSIEREDLRNFPNLRSLRIINSSLASISEDAFERNQHMNNIYIRGSKMTSIPKAITRLPNISVLAFLDSPITCSCDMAWLLGWSKFQKVRIVGNCSGNEKSLTSYTKYNLTNCVKNSVVG